MREIPEPEDPDDKLFDHLDELLIAIGDDALALVTGLLEATRTFRLQAILTAVLAALLTVSLVPVFLWVSVNYFSIVVYVLFLLVTAWFAVRTLMLYASYSARCTRMIEASKKFREAKAAHAA
jgi:hypothetical protein